MRRIVVRIGALVALVVVWFAGMSVPAQAATNCWTFYALPGDTQYNAVTAVKALSATDVWAVGGYPTRAGHFDGANWREVALPLVVNPKLEAMDGIAPDDIWTVGFYSVALVGGNSTSVPLILHWDGRAWKEIASPQYPGELTELYGVLALARDDAWAVGVHFDARGSGDLLIEHWDGKSWLVSPGPTNLGNLYFSWATGGLRSIAGRSNDLWASGANVVLHWDGKSWRVVYQQPPFTPLWPLAVSGDNVWVFGGYAYHWDGQTWSKELLPAAGSDGMSLNAVAADNAGNLWIVGRRSRESASGYNNGAPLAMRENAGRFSLVGDVAIAGIVDGQFNAVDVAPNGDLWLGGSNPSLARYSGACGTPPPALPAQSFPVNHYAIWGRMLEYWQANGGLAQFGYPISDEMSEVSEVDGKTYTVQYFERAELVYQLENNPPDDIQAIALGSPRYSQKYPNGAPGQLANRQNGRYFPETGHWVGGEFRDYWESHGGLAQQGAPLSDEFIEVSPLDRKPYKMQYFERAVFEYHPENVPPYRVLLSQLGLFRGYAKYPFLIPDRP